MKRQPGNTFKRLLNEEPKLFMWLPHIWKIYNKPQCWEIHKVQY